MALLLSRLPKEEYRVINDVLIQSNGHSTQIDHVVVSVYGIFVIETKYYKGRIYGGENTEFWTQNNHGHRHKFRNPLWQNKGHIMAITKILDDPGMIPVYSIVAFSHQASLKTDRSLPVMYWRNVVPYIKQHNDIHVSEPYAEAIYNTILNANVTDKTARKEHIRSVKRNRKKRDAAVANGICPRCGGILVWKDGRYGRFYGCSNYPRCKYILK